MTSKKRNQKAEAPETTGSKQAATALTSGNAVGTDNKPGAAYRLLASSVTGGSAVCTLEAG